MVVNFKLGHKVIFLHLRAVLVKAYVNKLKNNISVNFSLFHVCVCHFKCCRQAGSLQIDLYRPTGHLS